jgi:exonuclease III
MLTVLTYNILNGGRQGEDALLAIITELQPDIVVVQELLDERLLKRFARSLNTDWFFARGNSRYHLGLLSRYPIVDAFSYHRWPIRTALLEATIALGGYPLHLWGVHLMPHLGVPFKLWRVAEVSVMMQRTRRMQDEPCLIAGDWNAIAPDDRVLIHALPPALRWCVLAQGGRTYPWAIAIAQQNHWVDCFRRKHPETPGWTLPSHQPNARLDYLFANPVLVSYLQDCSIVTRPLLVHTASDHLPLQASFSLL